MRIELKLRKRAQKRNPIKKNQRLTAIRDSLFRLLLETPYFNQSFSLQKQYFMYPRTIWRHPDFPDRVQIIDQRWLPHEQRVVTLGSPAEVAEAIRDMWVRGAPLIGATAAYGMAMLAARTQPGEPAFEAGKQLLLSTRPTAINLAWAIERMAASIRAADPSHRVAAAWLEADAIVEEDVAHCRAIGEAGLALLQSIHECNPNRPVQVLTHCNAGRMATVEWGTATAPVYLAHQAGIPVHVWVDETRPRNQGASITAWELDDAGVPHTLIADNAGGHLMQQGRVDLVIVGADRCTRQGDAANKIGTYLKALSARDNDVPFYVALPSSTIDWEVNNGLAEIPIEARPPRELTHIAGWEEETGSWREVRLTSATCQAFNPAFDVTPARLITGLITERGCCEASEAGLVRIFPENERQGQPSGNNES